MFILLYYPVAFGHPATVLVLMGERNDPIPIPVRMQFLCCYMTAQTKKHTNKQRQKQTHTNKQTGKQTNNEPETQTNNQANKQTSTEANKQTNAPFPIHVRMPFRWLSIIVQTNKRTNEHTTNKQSLKQANKHTGKQTDKLWVPNESPLWLCRGQPEALEEVTIGLVVMRRDTSTYYNAPTPIQVCEQIL